MSRQYNYLISLFEDQNIATDDLRKHGRGETRPDLIGDNDVV